MLKTQRPIKLINDCGAMYDTEELISAILWKAERPVQSIKHVYMYRTYPTVSIHDKKLWVHRLLFSYWMQAEIPKGYHVHHINEDRLNATRENLTLIFGQTHLKMHNKFKTLTEEHKAKIGEAGKRRKHPSGYFARNDVTAEMVYDLIKSGDSISLVMKKLGIGRDSIKRRYDHYINTHPESLEGQKCEND